VVNGISIGLAIGFAILFNYGVIEITSQLGLSQTAQIINFPNKNNPPQQAKKRRPSPLPLKPIPTISTPTPPDPRSIPESYDEIEGANIVPQSSAPQRRGPQNQPAKKQLLAQNAYFLQIGAFETLENAQTHKETWPYRSRYRRWIGITTYDELPFKVLIGPFATRRKVNQYLHRKNINGFPVAGEDLLLHP